MNAVADNNVEVVVLKPAQEHLDNARLADKKVSLLEETKGHLQMTTGDYHGKDMFICIAVKTAAAKMFDIAYSRTSLLPEVESVLDEISQHVGGPVWSAFEDKWKRDGVVFDTFEEKQNARLLYICTLIERYKEEAAKEYKLAMLANAHVTLWDGISVGSSVYNKFICLNAQHYSYEKGISSKIIGAFAEDVEKQIGGCLFFHEYYKKTVNPNADTVEIQAARKQFVANMYTKIINNIA